jgi:phasin family protein
MPAKTSKTADFADYAKRAFAPAARLNETVVDNVERIARFQYELTGDLLQLSLDQLKAAAKAKDLTTLISKQRELGTKFVEKAQARQKDLAEIASESQAGFVKWVEDATALALGKA